MQIPHYFMEGTGASRDLVRSGVLETSYHRYKDECLAVTPLQAFCRLRRPLSTAYRSGVTALEHSVLSLCSLFTQRVPLSVLIYCVT